jgi:Spy/CpxP family protein refolding chaperone
MQKSMATPALGRIAAGGVLGQSEPVQYPAGSDVQTIGGRLGELMKPFPIFITMIALTAGTALSQTTQPVRDHNPEERFGQRIQKALEQLNLTADQKQKIDDILAQARQDFQSQLPDLRQATPEKRRQKVQEMLEGIRQEIADLLTPDQRQQLQELIRKRRKENPQLNREQQDHAPEIEKPKPAVAAPALSENTKANGSVPRVGDVAPNFSLRWLDGQPVRLSTFKGRAVVLIFGSYTTPVFRDKAAELSTIAQRYANEAKFIIIYTKEAHPSDGWAVERNKRDDIQVPQPVDQAGRKAVAEQAVAALHLENVPIALDTMNDATASAYGTFPDGVVVIGKDGKIAARQNWLDPTALPRLIESSEH